MSETPTPTSVPPYALPLTTNPDTFPELIGPMDRAATAAVADAKRLFLVQADNLWAAYLSGFDSPEEMQVHNCRTCRKFIETVGGLVKIGAGGVRWSVLWGFEAPAPYARAIGALRLAVERAPIESVFFSDEVSFGTESNIDMRTAHRASGRKWSHFYVDLPTRFRVAKRGMKDASQQAADIKQEMILLAKTLSEVSLATAERACSLLRSGALVRAELILPNLEWFAGLQRTLPTRRAERDASIWEAAAGAPAGWTHLKNGAAGNLIDMIEKGMDANSIQAAWDAMMRPDVYRRSVAAPTESNIDQAEKIVAAMGVERSLLRRFAVRADITEAAYLWRPSPAVPKPDSAGVFAGLREKAREPERLRASGGNITWEKFAREVLPNAQSLRFVPAGAAHFMAFVTAVHPDAPPILQWDSALHRNPVSSYQYVGGSLPAHWGLTLAPVNVYAIVRPAHDWGGQGGPPRNGVPSLLLEGAHDLRNKSGGGLFVEILRSEFNPIRKVIEKFQQTTQLPAPESIGDWVCGVAPINVIVRVMAPGNVETEYHIDRLD